MSDLSTFLKFKPHLAARRLPGPETTLEMRQAQYALEAMTQLDTNESPHPPSPRVIAAIEAAAATLNRYPAYVGDEDLRTALAAAIGQGTTHDNFVTGNGGCDVLSMIAGGFLSPGDECIICRPTFLVYEMNARRAGAEVVYVDLEPHSFSYDVEAILAAVSERTRLIYLCNPNNPTGTILSTAQMETLVNNVPAHVLIVSDEVYHHFTTTADFPNSLAYVQQGKNIVILHSFSKVFSLAGLRLGYAIAPAEIATYLAKARQPYHLSKLTIAGALAALDDPSYRDDTVALILTGRKWLYKHLKRLNVQTWPSQANFILFKPPHSAPLVAQRLERHGVAVRPLAAYYLPDHLRVTVGLPEENERFIAALDEVLTELG